MKGTEREKGMTAAETMKKENRSGREAIDENREEGCGGIFEKFKVLDS